MKVFASDFDGTIYFDNGFHKTDLKEIHQFQDAGNLFGLCTGRPLTGITTITQDIIKYDFYIVCSGALILDKNLNEIYKDCITHELMKDLYIHYKNQVEIFIQANQRIYTLYQSEKLPIQQTIIQSVDELNGDIYGLSLRADSDEDAAKICLEINESYPDVDAFQNKNFIDVVHKGCSKGKGIQVLKEKYKINSIAGIGDSYNDIPMLETVDISFTFNDSPQIVKDKTNYRVQSISEAIQILNKTND